MTESSLFMLVYLSSLSSPMSDAALEALVRASRERNACEGITGVLLHSEGSVIQCLEGPEASVRATFARISRDPRHGGIFVAVEEAVSDRTFPNWLMGNLQVTRSEFLALESAEWRRSVAALESADEPVAGVAMLRSFAETHRRP
ncbi:MAG: hypothetical protein RLZZ63_128 [Gemmatimonadota bacterium]|jgi:hypothetical protein